MAEETRPPSPEEITKKLSEFMRSNFGENIAFNASIPQAEAAQTGENTEVSGIKERVFSFHFNPREIKAHLDRFVIRQDEAKKVLSIAVCDHYNHAKHLQELAEKNPAEAAQIEIAKQNVILIGPTGVGKTYLVKHIAELIGVPFVKADATKFTETGYVGGDVDDLVRELVHKADGDLELAEHGIIYIDEIDKLATRGNAVGRDVSGRGVQTTLLKLMEETEVSLVNPMDIQSQMQAVFKMQKTGSPQRDKINTRHILFIVSGAFAGLEDIVRQRMGKSTIGFMGSDQSMENYDSEFLANITTKDLIDFGFEPEFVGRLPIRVVCELLEEGDLFEILKSSEGSLLRQYEREFAAYGIDVDFHDEALRRIAVEAAAEKTGARGLLTVCEKLLRNFKYELPDTGIGQFSVDTQLIENPAATLKTYLAKGKELSQERIASQLQDFAKQFQQRHQVALEFTDSAVKAVGEKLAETGLGVAALCKRLFKDYQFGLGLIKRNTNRERFVLDEKAIGDPDSFLSELVVQSYGQKDQG